MSAKPFVTLDPALAARLQTALKTTLGDMFGVPVVCDKPLLGRGPFAEEPYAASLLEMMQMSELQGHFIVTFSPNAVTRILTACGVSPGDASSKDAIEEVANVVYGALKKELNESGYGFVLRLPQTIDDKDAYFARHKNRERLVIPFLLDDCRCHVAIMALG
jgi:CheY-specific phosphatase CheX